MKLPMRYFRLCRHCFVRMFTLALFLGISFLAPSDRNPHAVPPDEVPQFGTFFPLKIDRRCRLTGFHQRSKGQVQTLLLLIVNCFLLG